MPFTPYHFGPHACVSLPFYRYFDIPIFIGANVAIDLEPLLVMTFNLDYPLHGYCHTLLIGGFVGLLLATAAYPFRQSIGKVMGLLRLPYVPTYVKMAISGVLGAWLHIFFDSLLHSDIRPFYPSQANPLYNILSQRAVYGICTVCFVPALILYVYVAFIAKRTKVETR
jgi:membrane-bound metal-dependent hydrolase YbcI (DUF457 family)